MARRGLIRALIAADDPEILAALSDALGPTRG